MIHFFTGLTSAQRSLISALAGFVFYAAWAYWVNIEYGLIAALKAACVQGGYSFILTFVMTMIIERVYVLFFKLLNNYLLIIWTTIGLTCLLIFSASWWVNVLAGTPEILETVILGYIVGGIYSVVYVYGLAKT